MGEEGESIPEVLREPVLSHGSSTFLIKRGQSTRTRFSLCCTRSGLSRRTIMRTRDTAASTNYGAFRCVVPE